MIEIIRRDGVTWARLDDRELRLDPSSRDPKRPRYWRAVDAKGKPLTTWLMTPKLAAFRGFGR